MHIYDYIVIGSGLTGLTIANKLSQETENVLLIESELNLGGSNKVATLKGHSLDNGLRFLPGSDIANQALLNLEDQLNIKLSHGTLENVVETYDASGFKPFLGFGDHAPDFYKEISYYFSKEKADMNLPWYKIVELMQIGFKGTTLNRSFVTGFTVEDDTVTQVQVNHNKQYAGKNFIFAASLQELSTLLPDSILSAKMKSKIKKDAAWMSVCLDLCHDVSDAKIEKTNLFLLDGTTNDSIGPCIGRFLPIDPALEDTTQQISQWTGFIDRDTAEETENISEVIKKMKRQIKRAFPEMSEKIIAERLYISSPLTAGTIKTNANGTLPKASNLWVASAQQNPFSNILGSLLQAQMTLASLGFGDHSLNQKIAQMFEENSANDLEEAHA